MGRLIAGLLVAALLTRARRAGAGSEDFQDGLSPVPVTAYNVNVVGSGSHGHTDGHKTPCPAAMTDLPALPRRRRSSRAEAGDARGRAGPEGERRHGGTITGQFDLTAAQARTRGEPLLRPASQ